MRAASLFRQIVYVDAALEMGGIVPSLSIFHSRMQAIIRDLEHALNASSTPLEQGRRLCVLLCHLIDRRIDAVLDQKHFPQQTLSLAQSLYGEPVPETSFETRLNSLLQTSTGDVFALSKALLAWLSAAPAGNEQAELLVAAWEERPLLGEVTIEGSPAVSHLPGSVAVVREGAILPLAWGLVVSALILFWLYLKVY